MDVSEKVAEPPVMSALAKPNWKPECRSRRGTQPARDQQPHTALLATGSRSLLPTPRLEDAPGTACESFRGPLRPHQLFPISSDELQELIGSEQKRPPKTSDEIVRAFLLSRQEHGNTVDAVEDLQTELNTKDCDVTRIIVFPLHWAK